MSVLEPRPDLMQLSHKLMVVLGSVLGGTLAATLGGAGGGTG